MSADELALLHSVAAAPDDDLPRLVYADWLDEHDQPVRAEFIRLQCEIARLQAGPRELLYRNVPLFRRQQDMLDQHTPELLGAGREALAGFEPRFDRGFLRGITLPVEAFIEHGAAVAEMPPPPAELLVTGVALRLSDFAGCPEPHLDLVTGIEMQSPRFSGPVPVHELNVEIFTGASHWPALLALDMEGCRIGDEGVGGLFVRGGAPKLLSLDLSNNDITDDGVATLFDSRLPQRLRRLVLGGNPLTDESAFKLADQLGSSTRLEHLNLRFTDIGHAGQQALLARFGGRIDLF